MRASLVTGVLLVRMRLVGWVTDWGSVSQAVAQENSGRCELRYELSSLYEGYMFTGK